MAELTPLDHAHAAMESAPEDTRARMAFYERLAASELFVLLEAEAQGDQISPETFEVVDQTFVLVFDREERLAGFAGREVPYAALSGRTIAGMLAGAGLGLGLNLDVAPSSFLIPSEAVVWLVDMLADAPEEVEARMEAFHAPKGLPEDLLVALDARLASASGLADLAYLVAVTYDTGARGHLLGIVDAVPGAQIALAQLVSEVLAFSGLEAAMLDVGFFSADDPVAAQLAKAGLRFDLPRPQTPAQPPAQTPAQTPGRAPGMDPDNPPILR